MMAYLRDQSHILARLQPQDPEWLGVLEEAKYFQVQFIKCVGAAGKRQMRLTEACVVLKCSWRGWSSCCSGNHQYQRLLAGQRM